jgi:hypothetical protein
MTATIDDPHDIAVIDDGDGKPTYAHAHWPKTWRRRLRFKHNTGGILSAEDRGADLIHADCAGLLRQVGLIVAWKPRRH